MLKPVHLRTLAVVVRTTSFSRAGRELGYTASAIAQQIAAMERELGVPLFVREPHRIRPTPSALLLAERGQHALDLLDSLEEEARAVAAGRLGRVRIGTALDPGGGLLAGSLALLKESVPGLEIELEGGTGAQVLERVRLGALDVGLVYDYPLAPRELANLQVVGLGEAPWLLAMPSGCDPVRGLAELSARDWFVGLEVPSGEEAVRALCADAGFEPRLRVCSDNHDLVLGSVAAGLGVGVVPALPGNPPRRILLSPMADSGATRLTVAVYLRRRNREAIRAAVRALRAAASRSPL